MSFHCTSVRFSMTSYRGSGLCADNRFDLLEDVGCELGKDLECFQVVEDLLRLAGTENDGRCVRLGAEPSQCEVVDFAVEFLNTKLEAMKLMDYVATYLSRQMQRARGPSRCQIDLQHSRAICAWRRIVRPSRLRTASRGAGRRYTISLHLSKVALSRRLFNLPCQ